VLFNNADRYKLTEGTCKEEVDKSQGDVKSVAIPRDAQIKNK